VSLMYVTDMTHFAGVDELLEERFAVVRRFGHYLGHIVGAGTANAAGPTIHTALPCRRRPGHRPCPGRLLVRRSEAPAQIDWACPDCGDEGMIYNFEGSVWDLSPVQDAEEVWTVILEPRPYGLLLGLNTLGIDSQRIVHAARTTSMGPALLATTEDLDALSGSVAAEASHEPKRPRRRDLDELSLLLAAATSAGQGRGASADTHDG
ncbi:MAG: hypothetical protein ACRDJU_08740, partial [Actinomycetota bacterium]